MSIDVKRFVEGLHEYLERAFRPIAERLAALEQRAPERGEKGEPGAPGKDGRDGVDGKDGRDGIDGKSPTLEDIRPLIEEAAARIPVPKDGRDGVDGKDGRDGRDGADGKSVTLDDVRPLIETTIERWALDFERRAQDLIQRATDRIEKPKDGRDGKDGLGFDDFTPIYDGERTLTLRWARGDQVKEVAIEFAVPIDRGVYRAGETYARGDSVSFGGSLWIAQRATDDKPGQSDAWRLAVKKGRDGQDGRDGAKGDRGPPGASTGSPPQALNASAVR